MDPEEDLTQIEWRNPQWFQQFGALTPENVLDYFSLCEYFWDKTCNNEVLKMQTRHNNLKELDSNLRKMTGVEYQVVEAQPPTLFIIRKQLRRSPHEVSPIASYYVLNANVYQAPDLYHMITNRLITSMQHLELAFEALKEMVEFQPGGGGYQWNLGGNLEVNKRESQDAKPGMVVDIGGILAKVSGCTTHGWFPSARSNAYEILEDDKSDTGKALESATEVKSVRSAEGKDNKTTKEKSGKERDRGKDRSKDKSKRRKRSALSGSGVTPSPTTGGDEERPKKKRRVKS